MTSPLSAASVGELISDSGGEKLEILERLAFDVGDIGGKLTFAPISKVLRVAFADDCGRFEAVTTAIAAGPTEHPIDTP